MAARREVVDRAPEQAEPAAQAVSAASVLAPSLARVLALQRQVGNAAVSRLIAPTTAARTERVLLRAINDDIANGHAFTKHVLTQREFPEIRDRAGFAKLIARVMGSTVNKALGGRRHAYWEDSTKTLVLTNPADPDGGTCFRPVRGKPYYDSLR